MSKKKVPRTERIHGQRIKCYAKAPTKFADPYTVVFIDQYDTRTRQYFARGMSARPCHPQGVGMGAETRPGPHLGRKISFEDLPVDCRLLVEQDARGFPMESEVTHEQA